MELREVEEIPKILAKIADQMRTSGVSYLKYKDIEIIMDPQATHPELYEQPTLPASVADIVHKAGDYAEQQEKTLSGYYAHPSLWPGGVAPDYIKKKTKDDQ